MLLTVVTQNVAHGGLANGDGDPQDRWPALAERIGQTRLRLLQFSDRSRRRCLRRWDST
ncbi:hypothetical protein [Frankia sp. Cr1]|uniref:hypothetical protein n=1 Tax=Frankia sp. Cr1 TaxID=3073931 RepID=UPI002AD3EB4E|nr:hypothetical protein [Frankia sp. Cr1]